MEPDVDFNFPARDRIVSTVGGRQIVVTANSIAEYLGYIRPARERCTFPFTEEHAIFPDVIRREVYVDPMLYTGDNQPGLFKAEYRLVSKIIHYNLFPRGSEHRTTDKAMEILYVFMSRGHTCDWAEWILYQLIDAIGDINVNARLPFPCMITALCRKAGVRVLDKDYVWEFRDR